jgi:thiamine biosynthesis protein ThiS
VTGTPGIDVIANGRAYTIDTGTTVEAFIRARGLDPAFVFVEANGEPLERSRYGAVLLAAGDRLELVRAVAGG